MDMAYQQKKECISLLYVIPGRQLSIPGLKRILRNRVYTGEWLYEDEHIKNNHLPIIPLVIPLVPIMPLKLFEFVQERLDASVEAFTRNNYI
jgi:hypothetical protein